MFNSMTNTNKDTPLGTIDDSLEITDRRLSEDQDVQTHINTAGDRYSGIKLCEQRTFKTKTSTIQTNHC